MKRALVAVLISLFFATPASALAEEVDVVAVDTSDEHTIVEVVSASQDGWERLQDGSVYYWNQGKKVTGWLELDGALHYFGFDGVMAAGGPFVIDGKTFYFGSDGSLIGNTDNSYSDCTDDSANDSSVDNPSSNEQPVQDDAGPADDVTQESSVCYPDQTDSAEQPVEIIVATEDIEAPSILNEDSSPEYEVEIVADSTQVTNIETTSDDSTVSSESHEITLETQAVETMAEQGGSADTQGSANGWSEKDGAKYYTDPKNGKPFKGGFFNIDGNNYCFDPEGKMVTGWIVSNGEVFYFDPGDGAMVTNAEKLIKGMTAPLAGSYNASFTDVNGRTPHEQDINWMLYNGISEGWVSSDGKRSYKPLSTLARADMAAFLYRLAGSPEFIPTAAQAAIFSDVNGTTAHADEIWWLAAQGIAEGWRSGNTRTFRPYSTLARADMAAFLYRLAGKPAFVASVAEKKAFSDVNAKTPHSNEIWWCSANGIAEGWKSGSVRIFRPYSSLARADMAAFMHRMETEAGYEAKASHEYRFAEDGALQTGWVGGEFYDRSTGAHVEKGWVRDGSRTSYIDPKNGQLLKGGPHTIAGNKYLFDDKGDMRRGWVKLDSTWYCFSDSTGAAYKNGTHYIKDAYYRFNNDGARVTGLVKVGNASYYFNTSTGKMRIGGSEKIGGVMHYFDNKGRLTKRGWQNPAKYPQVSQYNVSLPSYCSGYYVAGSRIGVDATRETCVETLIAVANEYRSAGSWWVDNTIMPPGGAIDCSGMILEGLYACGMSLEQAPGGPYNPWTKAHKLPYFSNDWRRNQVFMPVSSPIRGDIVYFDGHVGIYLGNGNMIDSTPGTVGVHSIFDSRYGPILGYGRPFV